MARDGINFEDYLREVLKDYKAEPQCPFPNGGECYLTEAERSCENCEYAKSSFIDRVLQKKKERRIGSRVFCVACGSHGRVPLRKWHNVYICDECRRILLNVGEEKFIDILKGIDK